MNYEQKIDLLNSRDIDEAYKILLEFEDISEKENSLYPYFDLFLNMIESPYYVIKLRGYRLACKQAKWDTKNKINSNIDFLLKEIEDQKATAVRQKIKALTDIVKYKTELHSSIKKYLQNYDVSIHQETMQGLIRKDINDVIKAI